LRRHLLWLAMPLSLAALLAPSSGAAVRATAPGVDAYRPGFQGEDSLLPGDVDNRAGALRPNATQVAIAHRLGAKARWNELGTPRSLFNRTGFLSGPSKGAPVDVARAWVRDNAALFRLTPADTVAARLEVLANNALYEAPDNRRRMNGLKPLAKDDTLPHVVLFRQVFGGVPAGDGGLLTVGLDRSNRVTYVSSSVTGATKVTNAARLAPAQAWRAAAADAGWTVPLADVTALDVVDHAGFTKIVVTGASETQLVRLRAVPTPRDGVRLAYEVDVMDNGRVDKGGEPLGYMTFVDAQTGRVLTRHNAVQHAASGLPAQVPDPRWKAFPNSPQLPVPGQASPDDRKVWCWVAGSGCDTVFGGGTFRDAFPSTALPYDEVPAQDGTGVPSGTSSGNDAHTTSSYASHLTPDAAKPATPMPTRNYDYAFTDQWHTSNCNLSGNYASPALNDIDAAIENLFFSYGRMHDWSYYLGFTESAWNMQVHNFGEDDPNSATAKDGDPEAGQAQAGAVAGSLVFTGRDNANQRTMQDGVAGVTNQYLWHPLQAGFYSPCVDGAFDMTVVGHEYTHAISNRMIGGPDASIGGTEGPKMGESWSDLAAMEYINGYGFAPVANENPYAVGAYATGSLQKGIRNYAMNDSALNYSDLAYDGNGATSPHADGEIWSAANFTVRQALNKKYDAQYPSTDKALQYACADGLKVSTLCPGNRRWIQLMFDGFLLQEAAAGMPAAAEAQIAADQMRYNGANQKELWAAYASRGLGDLSDEGGTPDWSTPLEAIEANVRFQAEAVDGGGVPAEMFVFQGHYSARTVEAASAKAGLPTPAVKFVPGTYEFVARANGYGAYRFTRTFTAGQTVTVKVPMRKNWASVTNGAEAAGDGGNFEALIDDTEETNWAFLGADENDLMDGKQVTVALAGGAHVVKEVQVSAANRPAASGDPYDGIAQSRFAALRQFAILTCDASAGEDCESEDAYQLIYTSAEDAFPTGRPRPLAPDLGIRTFDVPDTKATHVRIKALTNQCTGNPIYSDEANPVGEPASNADCVDGFTAATLVDTDPDPEDPPPLANNTQKHRVRISELQVFSSVTPGVVVPPVVQPPVTKPPVVAPPPTMPSTGVSPALGAAALLMAAGSALALRRRRTA
jgi:extracellular elastinolytic metalloproteinase